MNNYDKIAKYYDFLSRMVFFKAQVNAQVCQLKYIAAQSQILIVGGGTGWVLEEISKVHAEGLRIVYLEISTKMIELSRLRDYGLNQVEFVNQGIEEFKTSTQFDLVCTPFLFDNFSQQRTDFVLEKLDSILKVSGLWLLADFNLEDRNGKWWKHFLLKSMYAFFSLLKIVEARRLPDTKSYFDGADYVKLDECSFYGGFIQSVVYKKHLQKEEPRLI